MNEPDFLTAPWCCLTCGGRFTSGKIKLGKVDKTHPIGFFCPVCTSGNLQPVDSEAEILTRYYGKVSPLSS